MSDFLTERRISGRAFLGHYAAAIAVGLGIAVLCFAVPVLPWLSPIGILPLAGMLVYARVARLAGAYRLFEDRLEVESGILNRRIENVELFRIRDVGLRQGLAGRLWNFGDVYIHSTDSSTPDLHVRGIDDPREFYQRVRKLVSESRAHHRTMIVEEGTPRAET